MDMPPDYARYLSSVISLPLSLRRQLNITPDCRLHMRASALKERNMKHFYLVTAYAFFEDTVGFSTAIARCEQQALSKAELGAAMNSINANDPRFMLHSVSYLGEMPEDAYED